MGTPEGSVPRQGQPRVGGLLGGGKIGEDAEEEVGSKGKRSRQRRQQVEKLDVSQPVHLGAGGGHVQ